MQSPLFLPNNHSKWNIAYRPVSPEVKEEITNVFMKHYGEEGDEVSSVEQVDEAADLTSNRRRGYTSQEVELGRV